MSVDGRDEPLESSGAGDTETGGLPAPQVPSQGGPLRDGAPDSAPSGPSAPAAPSAAPGENLSDPSVPQQREHGVDAGTSVLPSPRETPPADADLIARMRSGDDTAYEELYRRHSTAVHRYARTCCRDGHTADDLTAEVFARMLQAVRGGSGPEHAVRAYLLTTVRRVAAGWTKSAKREHLVEDFAVFAQQAARSSEVSDDDTLDLGADVRAMHEAEQSMAMQAFRSLPERWQAVLWHTEVEDESPSEVATLFGLDANGTRVLAKRAREGLKEAYLQAHVSTTLTQDEECARYADRLGAYARGSLRTRAERGLRKHLEECAKCRLAAGQIKEVAGGIPGVVPVAVIGWFGAAGYAKVVALIGGGAASAAGAGAAAAAGGSSGGAAGGGAAASEGLGAPVKAGIAAGVVAAGVAVAVAIALAGDPQKPKPEAHKEKPAVSQPITPPKPTPPPKPKPEPPAPPQPTPPPKPAPKPTPTPKPTPKPTPPPKPAPKPTPKPTPKPPPPPPAPAVYQLNQLSYAGLGDGTKPEIRPGESSWMWQRYGLRIADKQYANGVTVHATSSVTIDLNRSCTAYDAFAGVDDMTLGTGAMRFSVYADGVRLWKSQVLRGGDPAVPVHVNLAGRKAIRLVTEPQTKFDSLAVGDWAESRFTCR
ncbi:sigma-70 family RNA polymerase sigma factor [Streptomyces sp. NBC_00009]|uniref:sigma-70 family RNA polymerase sigma factor n=1 Tax=Streptomyces sp. NBC_00009 TaxID=2975620 RepID=UPI00324A1C36